MKFHQKLNELASQDAAVAEAMKDALTTKLSEQTRADLVNKLVSLGVYWDIIVLILGFVKIFTGAKADAKIDECILAGNALFK
jgi:hypothetical protein